MKKNVPTKRHPLFQKENTLDFGDFEVDELTEDQKTDAFISKYMDVFDPIKTYEKYFKSSAKSVDHILRDVKLYYKKLVLQGEWSEKKYVVVINDIFENNTPFTVVTLDRNGLLFEKEQLASQRRAKTGSRRRI